MPTINSSGSRTANGSSPTMSRAHHTAWPRPSGCCWRTVTISPKPARDGSSASRLLPARSIAASSSTADVEIVDQARLAAAGDEDHLLDPRLAGFVDRILDQRPVDDRQHLLGHGLGRGEQPGAEPRDREDGFADALAHCGSTGRPFAPDRAGLLGFREHRRGAAVGRRQVEPVGLARSRRFISSSIRSGRA